MAINNEIEVVPIFKNIDPIIKIYCNKRKKVWFKDVNKCTNLIDNPNTYIIYNDKNGEQKILPRFDYVGPDLLDKPCSDLEQTKILKLILIMIQNFIFI